MTPPRPMTHVSHDRISHAMVPEFLPEAEPETSGYLFIFAKRKESRDRTSTIELHRVDSGVHAAQHALSAQWPVPKVRCTSVSQVSALAPACGAWPRPAPAARGGAGTPTRPSLSFGFAIAAWLYVYRGPGVPAWPPRGVWPPLRRRPAPGSTEATPQSTKRTCDPSLYGVAAT
jgi:hypothetical protein